MRGITKHFGSVIANRNVDLTVEAGSIHALLGENGAGKTTLMNILYGLYQADGGEILWEGRPVRFREPGEAIAHGIGMVHQHFMLVRNMTVLQNIILGLRPAGYPLVNGKQVGAELAELSKQYGLVVDMQKRVDQLSVGEQQRVEILKALYRRARLLILDEPTAVLTPQETRELFTTLRRLRDAGCSTILISHRLTEIMEVSDRITVLRDGCKVADADAAGCSERELSHWMIGRELNLPRREHAESAAEAVLEVQDLSLRERGKSAPLLEHISFQVRSGEILGIAGVDGNGQGHLAELICGIRRQNGSSIRYRGQYIDRLNVRQRFALGISYIPDDRHRDGLILDADVQDNLMLHSYRDAPFSRRGVLNRRRMTESARAAMETYDIRAEGPHARVGNLSGGNQQKIILARELGAQPSLLVAMQPTRGLDIGASAYVHDQLAACRDSGGGVLLISTDLEEIMALSDRIAVLFGGRLMGILPNTPALKTETLGLLMGGRTLEEVRGA